jgi:hypothetical protein
MDPYLEASPNWPKFQRNLMACLGELLQPVLGERYRLRTATRTYTTEQVLLVSVIREEQREEYLEIRHRATGRVVTIVDMVAPVNRTTPQGRKEYLTRREEVRRSRAHLVEMDLVIQGQSCLDLSSEGLPDWDYVVSVCRAQQPDRYEVYTTTLQKRLPRFRLPLASDDRDTVVDLQAVFTRCYEQCFVSQIDYAKDPPILLDDSDQKWVHQLLKQHRLR